MISKEELKEVLKKGGDILQYLLLNYINLNVDIEDIKQNIKIAGVISLMIKKDLIQLLNDGKYLITEKGKQFLNLEKKEDVVEKKLDVSAIKDNLSNHLKSKIDKKQIQGFGGVYFIPTVTELETHLSRFWKKYPKFNNLEKIEKILIKHIDDCCKKNSFAPAIKYFIYKENNGGCLGAAYENFEEEQKEESNNFDGVNI